MRINGIMWTWDVIYPEPEPDPDPEPGAAPAPGESLHSPRAISRLFAAIFDTFRDEPDTYHRLAAVIKAWREKATP